MTPEQVEGAMIAATGLIEAAPQIESAIREAWLQLQVEHPELRSLPPPSDEEQEILAEERELVKEKFE
jgi:hypothetical protein